MEQLDLAGRRLTVVGGTNGLGRALANEALRRGAQVTVVGRTLRDAASARLTFLAADLSSIREAVRVGRELEVENDDVLLLTTGVFASTRRAETPEGIERDMAVSFLSRLAVVREAAARLGAGRAQGSSPARVFVMGSPGWGELGRVADLNSERHYTAMAAHGNTLAGNEALVVAGHQRFPGPAYFGLAPGVIRTGIRADLLGEGSVVHRATEAVIGLLTQTPEAYARRLLPVLFAPGLEGHSGKMFGYRGNAILPSKGFDLDYAHLFLAESEALLARALGVGGAD
ncbi:SDR family NAD(P)-dependent oxidoreductase [Streptomyces sp. NPDC094468]|uniref:SDR family NAD(P)-dependent oxidoreductase n=1 Tax=Streptomyces sp. NPDC094468 TaxID=3366066 RepID=UPI00381DEA7F